MSFNLLYNFIELRAISTLSYLCYMNELATYLRSKPALNTLPSATNIATRAFSSVFIFLNIDCISVKNYLFIELRLFGLLIVTLTILPYSKCYTLKALYDISYDISININNQMNKALKIIPNKSDKSITLMMENAYFSIIWLHGLGDSPAGFVDYFQIPNSPVYKGAKVKLLHAPFRKVTINGGAQFPSWYDIKNFSFKGSDEELFNMKEVNQSLQIIDENVKKQIQYWKQNSKQTNDQKLCKRIFVGGFSQGCVMSMLYGLTSKRLLGGIIGFSGHLFRSFELINKEIIPMLTYHGQLDDVIDYRVAKIGYDTLIGQRKNFTYKLVAGLGHSLNQQQLQQTTQWLMSHLKLNHIYQ